MKANLTIIGIYKSELPLLRFFVEYISTAFLIRNHREIEANSWAWFSRYIVVEEQSFHQTSVFFSYHMCHKVPLLATDIALNTFSLAYSQ